MGHSGETTRINDQGSAAAAGHAWRVVGAAVPGASHLRQGIPCQDAQAARVLPGGELVIALADGAGSAQHSERGAARAVAAALEVLAANLAVTRPTEEAGWEQLLRSAVSTARQAVLQLAENEQEAPRAYAATLTCLVAADDLLAVSQIGDGTVVGVTQENYYFTATQLQRGEYANETHFITQEDALQQVAFRLITEPVQALAVMSDGLVRLALKMPSQEPHLPFFQPLFHFARSTQESTEGGSQLAAFLGSERVNNRTDDDKSLVLAVRSDTAPQRAARAKQESAL